MINEDASQRRKLRVEKINRQRRKLKDQANLAIVKQPSSTSSAQRKEARKIRNRESAVASRKRKIEEYEIVQTRCALLEMENRVLRMRLAEYMDGGGVMGMSNNRQLIKIEPAAF
mmetsp:Transcript_12380/g.12468  ORF Transcript_12380/g.12468 Transcript_12380/m.12468 type:complete len:115 (-) Transcript_12380:360-704(-)